MSTMRLILATAALALVAACGGSSPAAEKPTPSTHSPTGPKTFSASGYIDVDGYALFHDGYRVCLPDDGYDDITSGAQVKVSDASGETVALGRLETQVPHGHGYMTVCRFNFTVDDIPEGSKLYSVEVSHRGALTYSEDEMKAGLAFTLGS